MVLLKRTLVVACLLCGLLGSEQLSAQIFLRGDVNCDGCVDNIDAYDLLQFLFSAVPLPCNCEMAQDADGNNVVNLADANYILAYVAGGPPPPAPFPVAGPPPIGTTLTCVGYPAGPLFKRGDADQNGCVNAADAQFIVNFLFTPGSPAPACMQSADANDDDIINIADANYINAYCSLGGPAPPAPGPLVCGPDPTPGLLTCGSFSQAACCNGCANQLPNDCNQDGTLDVSDAVCALQVLFGPNLAPCADGSVIHPSNRTLMNTNGDAAGVDISDVVYFLAWQFLGGPPPAQGTVCIYIPQCPQNPACPLCP